MRRLYDNIMTVIDNEGGMTMVFTLMILLLLTIIGVAAITTSTMETMISSAETEKRSTYYAAESGAEHATNILRTLCISNNQPNINLCRANASTNCKVDWSFALKGSEDITDSAAKLISSSMPSLMERFEAGAKWIQKDMGHGYSYDVRVWNNNDPGDYITDKDGSIHLLSIGTGPNKGKSAIEIVLAAYIGGSGLSSYMGQKAAGSGKNSSASDIGSISDTNIGGLGQLIQDGPF